MIDRAAACIPRPRHAICSVVTHDGVAGVFVGNTEAAWSAAADLSAQRHVIWMDRPYKQVLSVLPAMYDELWVGAKGMYKTEPAIADGGEVIIYAPHLHEVSVVHGTLIHEIGYHVRDYFTAQWDKFKHIPWGVLAHSTHVKGSGTFDGRRRAPAHQRHPGHRHLRGRVPRHQPRLPRPGRSTPQTFANREDEGVLLVPKAGEYLYRVRRAEGRRARSPAAGGRSAWNGDTFSGLIRNRKTARISRYSSWAISAKWRGMPSMSSSSQMKPGTPAVIERRPPVTTASWARQ